MDVGELIEMLISSYVNGMTFRALWLRVKYKLKRRTEDAVFKIAVMRVLTGDDAYYNIYKKLWNVKNEENDKKTGGEIISEVLNRHGIAIEVEK